MDKSFAIKNVSCVRKINKNAQNYFKIIEYFI